MAQAELKTVASLDDRAFSAGLGQMKSHTDTFGAGLGRLKGMIAGAFTISAITSFTKSLMNMADDMVTTAETFGLSVESVLALQSAMAGSAVGAEDMMRIFGRLKDSQAEVANKNKIMLNAVAALGIGYEEFMALPIDRLLARIGEKYVEAGRSTQAFGAISDIFGQRIGPAVIEVLERINTQGLDGFIEKSKEAADATRQFAAASDYLEESIVRMKQTSMTTMSKVVELLASSANVYARMFEGKSYSEAVFLEALEYDKRKSPAAAPGAAPPEKTWQETPEGVKALEAWFRKKEELMLRDMSLAEQAAWHERELKAVQADAAAAAVNDSKTYYELENKIFELKKKIRDIEEKQAKAKEARVEKELAASRDQLEVLRDAGEQQAAIAEGRGIPVPDMARVDSMQRMGGIVGGVAGAGSQAARIAERQLATAEAMRILETETNRKLADIEMRLKELQED